MKARRHEGEGYLRFVLGRFDVRGQLLELGFVFNPPILKLQPSNHPLQTPNLEPPPSCLRAFVVTLIPMSHDQESDEELDDRELPDERDVDEDDDDAPAVVECAYCGRDMVEEAAICPHCRSFISREDAPPERRPLLIVLIVLLLVGVLSGLIWLIW